MRIFSGIQPTGQKHLGNYIGAIRQYVEGQQRAADAGDVAIYCVVDLHAMTVPFDPQDMRSRVYDTAAILLAAGLDPERCIFIRQSDIPEHTELCWLLSGVCAHGDLNRMTQFKEKSAQQKDLVSAGIFIYPLLQAADVLAYQADEVPVGEDQRQHIELMREVARRFNERFGETLVVPDHRIPEIGARVMDLQEPGRKMSTSVGFDSGRVYLLETEKETRKKLGSAVTDSGREVKRGEGKEGVANLIGIYAVATGKTEDEVEAELPGGVKERGADVVAVPRPDDAAAGDRAAVLLVGHHVGHDLAGMARVGQPVDHRHRRIVRELLERRLLEGPDHDRVHEPRQDLRRVRDRLAVPELHLGAREHEAVPAHLPDTDVEAHAGPCRGLLEDQCHHPTGQRPIRVGHPLRRVAASRLHRDRPIEDLPQSLRRRHVQVEEVPHANASTAVAAASRRAIPSSASASVSPTEAICGSLNTACGMNR